MLKEAEMFLEKYKTKNCYVVTDEKIIEARKKDTNYMLDIIRFESLQMYLEPIPFSSNTVEMYNYTKNMYEILFVTYYTFQHPLTREDFLKKWICRNYNKCITEYNLNHEINAANIYQYKCYETFLKYWTEYEPEQPYRN